MQKPNERYDLLENSCKEKKTKLLIETLETSGGENVRPLPTAINSVFLYYSELNVVF